MTRQLILPSSMHKPWAESERKQSPHVSMAAELNTIQGGTANPYLSSSLPFCLRFNVELRPHLGGGLPYNNAAKLDTGPRAKSYPGGIRPRSSSNHFQSARSSHGSSRTSDAANHASLSVLFTYYKFKARPRVIDSTHFYVNEPKWQRNSPERIFRYLRRHTRRFLWSRHPNHPILLDLLLRSGKRFR